MEIIVEKNSIYDYALSLTAKVASGSDVYDRVAITPDNYPMLDTYLSMSVARAESAFKMYLSASNLANMYISGESVRILLKEQTKAATTVYNLIKSHVLLYLANSIATQWLSTTPMASISEQFGILAENHLQGALSAIRQKELFQIPESDYGIRQSQSVVMHANNDTSDYGIRQDDNLHARPGCKITNSKILMVRSEESSDEQDNYDIAVTNKNELLTTN